MARIGKSDSKNNITRRAKYIMMYARQLGLLQTFAYFLQRILFSKNRLISVRIRNSHFKIYLRSKTYDVYVFHQIFINAELDFEIESDVKTIFDLGANIGLSALYLHKKYPEAEIYCIEPEKQNFKVLQKNICQVEKIHSLRGCIAGDNRVKYLNDEGKGEASYYITSGASLNTIDSFQSYTVEDVMRRYQLNSLDLVKMDIEGAEYSCFEQNARGWMKNVKCLALEYHKEPAQGVKKSIHDFLVKDHFQMTSGEYEVYYKIS